MIRARLMTSSFSAHGYSVTVRANVATVAGLILGSATVYLAARYLGPLAAALASAALTLLVILAGRMQVAGLAMALGEQARLARVDDLTGLANDRCFREDLSNIDPSTTGHSLALIDVDQFKAFNDAFGHLAGDTALRGIGKILAGFEGKSTQVYRVGGDEFALMFANSEAPDQIETTEDIRKAVADHPWPLRPISVSIGIAFVEEDDASTLVDRADRRLYGAKRAGGNRVVAQGFEGTPST